MLRVTIFSKEYSLKELCVFGCFCFFLNLIFKCVVLRPKNNQILNVTTPNLGTTHTEGPTCPENQRQASP